MDRITSVKVLDGHRVRLGVTGGGTREVDLTTYLHGPIFDEIRRDPAVFRQVRVDPALGTLVWPNGADVCPDVLVLGRRPDRPKGRSRAKSRR
jgi:hypothetical protein